MIDFSEHAQAIRILDRGDLDLERLDPLSPQFDFSPYAQVRHFRVTCKCGGSPELAGDGSCSTCARLHRALTTGGIA